MIAFDRRRVLIGLGLAAAGPALADARRAFGYHGWRVDASRVVGPPAGTIEAVRAQLDLVEHAGLSAPVLALMRAATILVIDNAGEGVAYGPAGVVLNVHGLSPHDPQALNGLLQAYADKTLPGGFHNGDIERFRRAAIARHAWPKTAQMLEDNPDYFGAAAAVYLAGAASFAPFSRTRLARAQPDCVRWLASLFDAGRPRR